MSYIATHFEETRQVLEQLNINKVEQIAKIIANTHQQDGRLFFLGVGGSAANASHAVNDFRKTCGIEAYAPTDNVSELTARTNDEGWESVFVEWLKVSRLNDKDCIFVLSVGGGNREKNVSTNLVHALDYAKKQKTKVVGIVGRDGGYTAKVADACCIIPVCKSNQYNTTYRSFPCNCLACSRVSSRT